MEGAEGGESVGKLEGGLDLDICLGVPESLVTPLNVSRLPQKFNGVACVQRIH